MDEMKYDSSIFETLLNNSRKEDVLEDLEPQDITESIHLDVTDDIINRSNCHLIAYNVHVNEDDDSEAYNPKKNPDKAVDIEMEYPEKNLKIEIFLDTPSLEWDSFINGKNKLSPEQMEQFFKTKFYHRLYDKLVKIWPSSDKLFGNLLESIKNKKYSIDGTSGKEKIDEESGKNDFGTGKVDPNKSREKNAAGKQIRSRSGRLYIQPSDFSVKHDENEAYFCWPEKGKEFKWSQWADWKKIKPLCRMRWSMGTTNPHVYGLSLSPLEKVDEHRGFRAYDLTAQPILQYLTPEETDMIMDLTIVKKFLKHIASRINRFLDIPDEEVFNKINRPDKCTIDDIRKTKRVIKNAMDVIRNRRADTYIYT